MIKKLVQHGNSSALILDKTILQLLGADASSELELVFEGETLMIRRAETKTATTRVYSSDPKTQKAFEKVMKKHSGAFEKLAKK